MREWRCGVTVVLLLASVTALGDADGDAWEFEIAPYLWLPTIGGDSSYALPPDTGGGSGSLNVSVGPTDWLELLNMAVLVTGSASKGRLTLFSDFVYLSLGKDDGGDIRSVEFEIGGPGDRITIPVNVGSNSSVQSELDGYYLNLAAGYAYHQSASATHVVFGGARHLNIDTQLNWNLTLDITTPGGEVLVPAQGSSGRSKGYWDAIVGLRGTFSLGSDKWSVPYYFDVGGGAADLTWTAQVLLARAFDWGDLGFGYRHLEYDEGEGGLLQGFSFSGPGFGARFRF